MLAWSYLYYVLFLSLFKFDMNRLPVLFILLGLLFGQARIGEWLAYTAPLHINDITGFEQQAVCATNGGLLIYDQDEDTFNTLTVIDQLAGTGINVVEIGQYGHLWLGGVSPNGFVQVYDLKKQNSIAEFDFGLTEIIDISITDSIGFVAFLENQDWGLLEFIYRDENWIYRDVYRNWPTDFESINAIEVWDDDVMVATEQGLFVGDWRGSNLKDPVSWGQPYTALTGNISSLHANGSNLLLVHERNIYQLTPNTSMPLTLLWDYFSDTDLFIDITQDSDGSLWGILDRKFMKLSETAIDWQLDVHSRYSFTCLTEMPDGQIIAGSEIGITLIDQDNQTLTREIPNAPLTNQISAVTVLNDGRLVAGSKYGLSIKETWGWRNIAESDEIILAPTYNESRFAVDYIPVDFGGFVADMEQGPDGLLYCAIRGTYPEPRRHGGGIIIIDIDNPENFTLIDTAVLDYYANEYMVVKDLEFDASGILWGANAYATTRGNPITVLDANKSWGSFSVTNSGNILSYTPNTIGFDSFGRVWIGSFEDDLNTSPARNGGLVYLDYEGSVINPTSTEWGSVDINPGYTNNTVWSLAINDEDILYALTPIGLLQLTLQFSNADPVKKYGYVYFPNISYGKGSKVRLDSRNNVWTASPTQGVHVLTSGATYWPDINGFKQDNSQLLSNEVADIAFDNGEGLAYIATSQGISVLRMPFAVRKDSYNQTRVFPSPYHLPSISPLVIDGLMDESTCKVMTITGRVIRTLLVSSAGVNGYQAYWDGKDSKGRWADTGVYLISIYRDSGESEFEKIAVIQH